MLSALRADHEHARSHGPLTAKAGRMSMPHDHRISSGHAMTTRPWPAPERGRRPDPRQAINVSQTERLVSVVLGGALATYGLTRSSLGEGVLAVLGGGALLHRGVTGHCKAYEMLGRRQVDEDERELVAAPQAEASVTIGKTAAELHKVWSDPATLPQIMGHFAAMKPSGEGRTRWSVQGPLGTHVEWDTHVTEETPGLIAWRSVEGGSMGSEGWVRFRAAPGDRGTEVTLQMSFDPPGGLVGNALVKLLGAPTDMLIRAALRRFKSLVETGEIATLEHNPSARSSAPLLSSLRIAPQPI